MAQKIQSVKGMNDLFPLAADGMDILLWNRIETAARHIFPQYAYDEIRTPVVEPDLLFRRAVGETTDIVEKETYTFEDKSGEGKTGDSLTLRPEGTAGVVRAFIEHGLSQTRPTSRFWYLGPMFRRERPQKGRYRQFWQIGAECFGAKSPRVDAEQLAMLHALFLALEIRTVALEISSVGDENCRPPYKEELKTFLRSLGEQLCADCRGRIDKNPMRVLDCKKEGCRTATAKAPLLLDRLCVSCAEHFAELRRNLDLLHVPHLVNPRIVRGLDYYVRTAFELTDSSGALGSQSAVGGGGRYDGLVKELGGADVPGVGFALGLERLTLVLQSTVKTALPPMAFIAVKQLSKAEARNAKAAILLGEDELAKGVATVKDLGRREQVEASLSDVDALAAAVQTILNRG